MITIEEAEAIELFDVLLDRLEKGEEFVITRRGAPIAKLVRAVHEREAGTQQSD